MIFLIVLSVIAGALGLCYFLFTNYNIFSKHNIPHVKPLSLTGNFGLLALRKKPFAELVTDMYNIDPEAKYVGTYDMIRPMILLRDLDLIKSITVKNFEQFVDHVVFIREDQDPLFANNLFGLRGDKWRETRAVLTPAFTSSKMKSMFLLMSDCAVDFANFIAQLPAEQRVIETKDIFTRYTNDVIATCAFGVKVDSMRDRNNLFYVYGREATDFSGFAFLIKFVFFRNLPWLAKLMGIKFVREPIAKFFRELVETTIKTRDEKNIVRADMLQLMMESRSKKESGHGLTIEDMVSQAFSFFFGGFESTSTLMCFAAHEIATNEDVRKKLQNEIDQVLENTNGQAPYDAVNSMEYMDAVVNETLRMYPVAPIIDRMCIKDFELPPTVPGAKPFVLKEGQGIWVPVYGLQHDPKYFNEPETFNPDRFLGEEKKHILNTGAYLPFGVGPRMCIGNRFALLETKVLLFHLLARCDLLPCEKTMIPMKLAKGGTMKPENDFWLKAVPRKDAHHTVTVNNTNCTHEL